MIVICNVFTVKVFGLYLHVYIVNHCVLSVLFYRNDKIFDT